MEDKKNEELIANYRHLHQIPEIGLKEFETTHFILKQVEAIEGAEVLKEEVITELKTGLIVVVRANKENTGEGFLFRADIDALNFKEESGVSFASNNGMHHACGHDAHTSILISALKLIAARKNELRRDIYFCFQPGEEGHGGAFKLLQKYPNLFKNIKHCFGLHVGNHKEKGTLLIYQDYATANSNKFEIEIKGRSAHVMMPHLAIDANYIGCQIVNEIYSVKTRLADPSQGMTVAVTKIVGGHENVASISESLKISGTIRSFINFDHQRVIEYIEKYTKSICELNGASYTFSISKSNYRSVKNSPVPNKIVESSAEKIFNKVEYSPPCRAGEDFCEFSEAKPSCYFVLGVALPGSADPITLKSDYPLHSNKFKLDETALFNAVLLWESIAFSENI